MGVLRQLNVLGQMRLDVPHLRMMESAVAGDFDLLAGEILAGGVPLVVRGFALETTSALNGPATSLQLIVAGGAILHPLASESGTIFAAADDAAIETLSITNSKIVGGFTASADNYIGIDLRRSADDTTSDVVMFLDVNTRLQSPRTVPLARTIDFRIVISTTDFAATPHVCPIAKVTTNASNAVTAIVDARNMFFRLGRGGSNPDIAYSYPWLAGRHEAADSFTGGDKQLESLKDILDAITTRLWEVGGGQYWSSATSDRDVKLAKGPGILVSTGDNFEWTLGSSTLEWADLALVFANTAGSINEVADGTAVLADGQCLYVDIDRTQDLTGGSALTPAVAALLTLGSPPVPGSRFIIAWRKGSDIYVRDRDYEVGRVYTVATDLVQGTVQLSYAAGAPGDPLVAPLDVNGRISATATASNSVAFLGTGHGTGAGVSGVGGSSSGHGLYGTGGGPNGSGVRGIGTGTGAGGTFAGGGGATAPGAYGYGGSVAGPGLMGAGAAAGSYGVDGTGGANGDGVHGAGQGTGKGVSGVGGATGAGVIGTGGASGAGGVVGIATGVSTGVLGTGGPDLGGTGVVGVGGTAGGVGVDGTGTSAAGGVIGTGGPAGGLGVSGTGVGVGTGVVAIAGASGLALDATGGSVGGARITVTGSTIGNAVASSALRLRNSGTGNGTAVGIAMVHAAVDGNDDGFLLWTDRQAENDVDLVIATIINNVATDQLRFNRSTTTFGPAAAAGWNTTGWNAIAGVTVAAYVSVGEYIGITTQHVDLTQALAPPTYDVAVENTLNQRNIPKAWARIRIRRSGATSYVVTVMDGFNVLAQAAGTDVYEDGGGIEYLIVKWAQNFVDTNYVVSISMEHTVPGGPNGTTTFTLEPVPESFTNPDVQKTVGEQYFLPTKKVDGEVFNFTNLPLNQIFYANVIAFGQQ